MRSLIELSHPIHAGMITLLAGGLLMLAMSLAARDEPLRSGRPTPSLTDEILAPAAS